MPPIDGPPTGDVDASEAADASAADAAADGEVEVDGDSGCTEHADCTSGICDTDANTCVDASNAVIEGLSTNGVGIQCYEDATFKFLSGAIANVQGGTGINAGCSALFEDSVIRDIASEAISGDGITIRRCTLTGNSLAFSGYGDITIEQSVITNNPAGVQYYQLSSNNPTTGLIFRNNVISNNGDPSTGFIALSVAVLNVDAVVEHNTIIGNEGTAVAVDCNSSGSAKVTMTGNIIYDNAGGSVALGTGCTITSSDVEGGATGSGNIDVDPKFVAGDYHLQASSPCIDRVDSEVSVDIDDQPRPGGGANDMGADEVQ